MEQSSLNLSRKWRSAQFSEVVGQELVVRILQNSLFKNQLFPVYLMAGQRGCGKTSTARIFAAAVNCDKLFEFQKNPKIQVPCLACPSCIAMKKGQHPDFIEIDAASYTGVDNIRNIIDTSSFLPILGRYKIYLIDEVHMLSKAAFNALLKILEEPSDKVLFVLATTETQKIPDTVRSRCFQLYFNPIADMQVVAHLQKVCDQEQISYDQSGLEAIAQATQGSMRDALNLLEQVRFSAATVHQASVMAALGQVDDQVIEQMMLAMIDQDITKLLIVFDGFRKKFISIEYVVKRLLEFLYDCIIIKYGAHSRYSIKLPDQLQEKLKHSNIADLIAWFDEISKFDFIVGKTTKKQLMFESLLLRLTVREFKIGTLESEQKKK